MLFPKLYAGCGNKYNSVKQFGCWVAVCWKWNWDWTVGLLVDLAGRIDELKEVLQGISLHCEREDIWTWIADGNKSFTVKSCYKWLIEFFAGELNNMIEGDVEMACQKVWKCDVPTKVIVLAWRILIDRLPTRVNLIRRGVIDPIRESSCVMCFGEAESTIHLFNKCWKSMEVWRKVYNWLDVSRVRTNTSSTTTLYGVWFIARKGRKCKLNFSDWLNCPLGCLMSIKGGRV